MAERAKVEIVRDWVDRSTFHEWVGIHLDRLDRGEVDLSLDVRRDHMNLMGSLHGGVIASLADAATGIAVHAALDEGWTHATTSLHLTFLAPGRLGDHVVARGRVVKRGRRFGYAEADVARSDGTLLARASATFLLQQDRGDQ
ncbi:MAG TPA: PaaI family thioesterase [Actinomycetota bacterium]|nr:PaaI family thioesterase [Actinomycetota bacterium]